MLLTFLGTRANLPVSAPRHRRHSALQVEAEKTRLMIDCGSDWHGQLQQLQPDALLLTHAHDDHAGGLAAPLPVPVYAAAPTWQALPELAGDRLARSCQAGIALQFPALRATPLPLPHSNRAPAVGWLLEAAGRRVFYAPDNAGPPGSEAVFGSDLFIGDGSSFSVELLRIEQGKVCGHRPIPEQLEWCRAAGIAEAIFTHCGAAILAEPAASEAALACLAQAFAIPAQFAVDGLQVRLPANCSETQEEPD